MQRFYCLFPPVSVHCLKVNFVKRSKLFPLILTVFALQALPGLWADDILTAADFFGQMQDAYGKAADYEAQISIVTSKQSMSGTIIYKNPNLVRIDFSQPANQVICFNGDELTIYLPDYSAILTQSVTGNGAGAAGGANAQGLQIMKRNYSIAYESSTQAVALDATSSEKVIKLALQSRLASEGYRSIVLSVNPETKFIRRMEATTVGGSSFRYDFTGIKTNQGIPASRFAYEKPAKANAYSNFLFKSE